MSTNGVSVADLFADAELPSLEGGEDAETKLVEQMIHSVELSTEELDWLLMAEAYCANGYGRRLANRYIELKSRASTGRWRQMINILEALALKKYVIRLPGIAGPGMGGRP